MADQAQIGLRRDQDKKAENEGDEQSLEAFYSVFAGDPEFQCKVCGSACQEEEKAHVPRANHPDEDIGQQGAQLLAMDIEVLKGIKYSGRMEREQKKDCQEPQPVDVVKALVPHA